MEQAGRFARIEKLGELIVGLVIVSGLLLIQLPIQPTPNKKVIYIVALAIAVFTLAWHKIKLPLSPMNKNFIESIVDLVAIFVVVHVSGGIRSYFNFLYILPNLDTAATSTRIHTGLFWFLTAALIFVEGLFFPQPEAGNFLPAQISSFNLAILHAWSVALVAGYGLFLLRENQNAYATAEAASVEKEKSINKLKDEFLFIIAHELRGPVTAIRGYLELFLTGKALQAGGEVKNKAEEAFRQGGELVDLIAELLDLSRLETGKLKLSNERFDLKAFLTEILGPIEGHASAKKIEFGFLAQNAGPAVYADKERVRLVVMNLIDNALKYTGQGGKVWVEVVARRDRASVAVNDTGIGISPQELLHLFDRYYGRTSSRLPTNQPPRHLGFGLFLVKNLIEKMNGEVLVESTLGKGSKFTFTLPLAENQ